LKLYNILVIPSFLYVCEARILKQGDTQPGHNFLDRRRNEDNLEDLAVDPVEKKLAQCKQKWIKVMLAG